MYKCSSRVRARLYGILYFVADIIAATVRGKHGLFKFTYETVFVIMLSERTQ